MQKTENIYMADNNRRMPEVTDELFFVIDEKMNSIAYKEGELRLLRLDKACLAFLREGKEAEYLTLYNNKEEPLFIALSADMSVLVGREAEGGILSLGEEEAAVLRIPKGAHLRLL